MSTWLVTGTSRGLGLSLVDILNSHPKEQVSRIFAASRSRTPSKALAELIQRSDGRIVHVALDVASQESIQKAVSTIAAGLAGSGLDYLLNNAAVRDEWTPNLEDMTYLSDALHTNVVGTNDVTAAFLPILRQGRKKTIVNFSSTLGCITTAQTEPSLTQVAFPAYKISKAGTHMLTALWSNQLRAEGFCVYMQSPGNLKTELAGGDKADLPVEVGAKQVIQIAMAATPEDTGRHRNILVSGWEDGGGVGGRYDGKDLPW